MSTSTPQYTVSELCIYSAKIPNCSSESCGTEIIARNCFHVMPQAHKAAPHSELWSQDFSRLRCPCSHTGSGVCSKRGCSSPQGTQGCTHCSHLPHPSPALRVPFPTQLWSDTGSSSWAVTAPPVRAADNTPSHGQGYQQCAATFSRVNMEKMQGLQSCRKTCLTGIVQLTKIKC